MRHWIIIILTLHLHCATYFFPKIGGLVGKPLDYFLNEDPEKNLICKYTDDEFHKSYFNYSHNFKETGLIVGLLTDWALAVYYPLQNPKTIPIIGGVFYFFMSFIVPSLNEGDDNRNFKKKFDSNKWGGWQFNHKSKCSNLQNFYVSQIQFENRIENDKWVLCKSYEELAKEEFYSELAKTISLEEKNLPKLKKKITPLNFIEKGITSGIAKQTCNFKFYIEFEGGQKALRNSLK
jgi:hypothetical protein